MQSVNAFSLAALAGLVLVLTGCSVLKPKADPTRFYVLRAPAPVAQNQPHTDATAPGIRVGPGRIAGYLEVTPVAIQDGPNRISYLEFDHWAEPLSKGLTRTLGEDLCHALNLKQVTLYPDPVTEPSFCEVRYTVYRFEGTLEGPVILDVSWQLVQQPSARVLFSTRSEYKIPGTGPRHDPAAYVERLSDTVGRWAEDVAGAIRSHPITQ